MSLAVGLAVIAAVCIGTSDFFAGVVGRRDPSGSALGVTYAVVLAIALPVAVLGGPQPSPAGLGWGAAMGVFWAIGIFALARGIAEGRVVVVIPTAGVLSAAIPVLVDIVAEGRPGPVVGAGVTLGLIAVALTGIGDVEGQSRSVAWSAVHGVIGGVTTGMSLVLLDRAADDGLWPLTVAAVSAAAVAVGAAAFTRRPLLPPKSAVPPAVAMGLLVAISFVAIIVAFPRSSLTVVAVIVSQYPAVTILLTALVWRQRPRGVQYLGIAMALVAVALIAVG
jgi:hypothetical protein